MNSKQQKFDGDDGIIDTAALHHFQPHDYGGTDGFRYTRNNPVQNRRKPSPKALLRNASHGAELPPNGASRKMTPARAVFKDLTTAHSSITSGATRSTRSKPSSTHDLSDIEDENSIPLQALEVDPYKVDFTVELPVSLPATLVGEPLTLFSDQNENCKVTHVPSGEDSATRYGRESSELTKTSKTLDDIDFNSIANPENWPFRRSRGRKTKVAPASEHQYCGDGQSGPIGSDNQDIPKKTLTINESYKFHKALNPLDEHMLGPNIPTSGAVTSVGVESSLPMQLQSFWRGPNQHGYSHGSSLPEVDTIGDIVECYASSNGDFSEPSLPPLKQNKGSSHHLSSGVSPNASEGSSQPKQQQNITSPPDCSLPQSPKSSTYKPVLTSSQEMGTSPSYGDTHDLLDFSHQGSPIVHQRKLWTVSQSNAIPRSDALTDLRSDAADSHSINLDPFDSDRNPRIIISESNGISDQNNHKRVPCELEREISKALRRASKNSCYSDGSFDTYVNQHVNQGRIGVGAISVGKLQRLKVGESFPSRRGTVESSVPDNSFYNSAAVASKWVSKEDQREVRIPIVHNGATSVVPPLSLLYSRPRLNSSSGQGGTATTEGDWETDFNSEAELIECMIKRAGSSIANYSDSEAASSSIPEVDDFGSRERILQHPADDNSRQYAGYRVRNLKDTNQPIILPSHRNHSINGYLAESYHSVPLTSHLDYKPTPIPRPHRHPFNSSPPEIMEPTSQNSARGTRRGQAGREINRYQSSPLTFHTTMVSDITEASNESPYPSRPPAIAEGSRHNSSWEDTSITTSRPYEATTRKEITSFGLVTDLAQGKHVEGYNPDGTRVAEPAEARYKSSGILDGHYEYQLDESVDEPKSKQLRYEPRKTRFAKRPPGGLLRDIQARANAKLCKKSDRRVSKKRDFVRPHSIPDGMETLRPFGSYNSQVFTYRQPTAPPRRESTLALYHPNQFTSDLTHVFTQEELEARHAAKSRQPEFLGKPSISRPLQSFTGLFGRSSQEGDSRRQIAGYPRLIGDEEASISGTLCEKKENFGLVILILCNILFPMLFLYGWGYLDAMMWWYTNGEASKFGKGHKRWATLLAGLWLIALVLGIVGGVSYAIVRQYTRY